MIEVALTLLIAIMSVTRCANMMPQLDFFTTSASESCILLVVRVKA